MRRLTIFLNLRSTGYMLIVELMTGTILAAQYRVMEDSDSDRWTRLKTNKQTNKQTSETHTENTGLAR